MSSSMNLEADAIQHIDDACEEEYIESFAPKAQEEVLSEIQTGDSDLNSNQNEENTTNDYIAGEMADNSESVDISNEEEINATSNELVHEVMTEIESTMAVEDEQILNETVDEENMEANCTDNDKTEENLIGDDKTEEILTADNKTKEILIADDKTEEILIADEKTEELIVDDTTEENLIVDEKPEENLTANDKTEEILIVDDITEENLIVDDKTEENCIVDEKNEEKIFENSNLDINNIKDISNLEKNLENDEILVENSSITCKNEEASDIPSEINTCPVEIAERTTSSPTKGKDVKSLSSAYGHEENLININCYVCNKKVYPMEKLVANDKTFHKMCFRCSKCKSALTTGNYSFNQQLPYCTTHYIELFKKRGRYDEVDDNNQVEKEIPITNDINDVLTDELPAPDTTKNMLAKFKNYETGNASSVNQTASVDSINELPAPNTTKFLMEKFSAINQEKPEGKCKPQIDIPRHANGHSNGTSENVPVELPSDVVRANDPSQDDRPEQGITKNLVNRFRELGGSLNN